MLRNICLSVILVVATMQSSPAADWPAFRGPEGTGIATEDRAPIRWSAKQGIAWKAPLPQAGNGSPIVVRGRALVTSAEDGQGRQRSLYCFDTANGEPLWVRTVAIDQTLPTHKTNPYGGSTPASDGQRVVVWHASAGLYCYDLDGNELWSRDLGEFRHMWGYGSSPIVYKDRVILHTGPGVRVFVTAINLNSGETIWETEEPLEGSDRNTAGKYMGSWSTPVVARTSGEDQILVMMPTRINAYDPQTGRIVWTCSGNRHGSGDLAYGSPVIVDDSVFMTGGFRGISMGIRLGGTGDVTNTHRLYRTEKNPQSIGSPVAVDDYVYRPNAGPATIECIEPHTGNVRWAERAGVNHWASIVMANGLLYATDQDTTTTVFRPNPDKLDVVATNQLPGSCNATPAIANGCIFIRTDKHLYAISR